jgi:hypothetical protein
MGMTSTPIEGEGINLKWIKNITRERNKKKGHFLSHARQKLVAISTHSDVEGKGGEADRMFPRIPSNATHHATIELDEKEKLIIMIQFHIHFFVFLFIFLVVFFFSFLCQVTVFQLKTIEEHARHHQIKIKDCAVRSCNNSSLIWSRKPPKKSRTSYYKKCETNKKFTIRDDNISKYHPGIILFFYSQFIRLQ